MLLPHLQRSDSGVYTCTGHHGSFSRGLARYHLHVLASEALRPGQRLRQDQAFLSRPQVSAGWGARKWWLLPQQLPPRSSQSSLAREEPCEQLWQREKRRQQKLRTLKQEVRKARVRRNNPPGDGGTEDRGGTWRFLQGMRSQQSDPR